MGEETKKSKKEKPSEEKKFKKSFIEPPKYQLILESFYEKLKEETKEDDLSHHIKRSGAIHTEIGEQLRSWDIEKCYTKLAEYKKYKETVYDRSLQDPRNIDKKQKTEEYLLEIESLLDTGKELYVEGKEKDKIYRAIDYLDKVDKLIFKKKGDGYGNY